MKNNLLRISYVNGRYGEVKWDFEFTDVLLLEPNEHSKLIKCLLESLRSESHRVFAIEAGGSRNASAVKRLLPYQFDFQQLPAVVSVNGLVSAYRTPFGQNRTLAGVLGWQQFSQRVCNACSAIVCPSCESIIPEARGLDDFDVGHAERLVAEFFGANVAGEVRGVLVGKIRRLDFHIAAFARRLKELADQGFRRFAVTQLRRIEDETLEAATKLADLLRMDAQEQFGGAKDELDPTGLGVVLDKISKDVTSEQLRDAVRRAKSAQCGMLVIRPFSAGGELPLAAREQVLWSDIIICPSCGAEVRISEASSPLAGLREGASQLDEFSAVNITALLSWLNPDAKEIRYELERLDLLLKEANLSEYPLNTKIRELSDAQLVFLSLLVLQLNTITDCMIMIDSPAEVLNDQESARFATAVSNLHKRGNWVLIVDSRGSFLAENSQQHVLTGFRRYRLDARLNLTEILPGATRSNQASGISEWLQGRQPAFFRPSAPGKKNGYSVRNLKEQYHVGKVVTLQGGTSWKSPAHGIGIGSELYRVVEDELLETNLAEAFSRRAAAREKDLSTAAFMRSREDTGCAACAGRGRLVLDEGLNSYFEIECGECLGSGLSAHALEVTLAGFSIVELRNKTLSELAQILASETSTVSVVAAAVKLGLGDLTLNDPLLLLNDGQRLRILIAKFAVTLRERKGAKRRAKSEIDKSPKLLLVLDRVLDGCTASEFEEFCRILNEYSQLGLQTVVVSCRSEVPERTLVSA